MKMVFCDIDGTLYKGNEPISPLNKEALLKFQQEGGKVVYCTGRHILEMGKILMHDQYPFDYLILNNGGTILDKNKHLLYDSHIEAPIGLQILKWGIEANMHVYMCDGQVSYGYLNHQTYLHSDFGDQPIDADFMAEMSKCSSFQIISYNQEDYQTDRIEILKKKIEDEFGDYVECHPNLHFLDIVPKGCSKGTGVNYLKNLLNVETYTIGDSYNDLPMIIAGDHGCTFDYAEQEIKEQADHVYHYVYEMINAIRGGII